MLMIYISYSGIDVWWGALPKHFQKSRSIKTFDLFGGKRKNPTAELNTEESFTFLHFLLQPPK